MSLLTLVRRCLCPWLLVVIHDPWWMVVCGQLSSFVGGWLHFLGSHGGGAVVGCRWHSWAIMVKSVVGGGRS